MRNADLTRDIGPIKLSDNIGQHLLGACFGQRVENENPRAERPAAPRGDKVNIYLVAADIQRIRIDRIVGPDAPAFVLPELVDAAEHIAVETDAVVWPPFVADQRARRHESTSAT